MPTPFYHLSIADELLRHSGLSEPIQDFIREQRSSFFFGHIAPDVQVISEQPRKSTHFFVLPPKKRRLPWKRIFDKYPQLADGSALSPAQAVFIAGYLCHLQADTIWIHTIFIPYFGPKLNWGEFRRRLHVHNVLRTFIDAQILKELPAETGEYLRTANGTGWLPFADDRHLAAWREFVAEQLRPGAEIKTLDVFADRAGVSKDSFSEILNSQSRLDEEVFSIVPPEVLVEYRQKLIQENTVLLRDYLQFAVK